MDSEAAKLGLIALALFVVYTALVFERLYRENFRPQPPNREAQNAPRKKAGRRL